MAKGGVLKPCVHIHLVAYIYNSSSKKHFFLQKHPIFNLQIQINRNLEELARLIYDYWFVQFDFPNEKGKPYKSSGGKMVWNNSLKREIPEGWQLKRIEDVCKRIQSGGTPATSRKDLYDGSLNWFSTQELQDNFLFDSIKHISPNALKESSAKLFPKDTILIAIYAAAYCWQTGNFNRRFGL